MTEGPARAGRTSQLPARPATLREAMSEHRGSKTTRPFGWQAPALDPLGRWAAALGLLLVFLALRLELPLGSRAFPFLAFFPPILLAAWISGRAPALGVTLAGAAASWWFLIRPPGVLAWPSPVDAAALAFFVCAGAFAVALVAGLARSRAAEAAEREVAEAAEAAERAKTAELHHRIANTLQLVASAVMLHTRSGDGRQAEALADATRRLDALARLHRQLVSGGSASDPRDVLTELCRTQLEACGDGPVTLDFDIDPDIRIDANRLTTLAMIASEGLSNALKHAFPEARAGHLQLRLRTTEPGWIELEIRDDGIGLREDLERAGRGLPGPAHHAIVGGAIGRKPEAGG